MHLNCFFKETIDFPYCVFEHVSPALMEMIFAEAAEVGTMASNDAAASAGAKRCFLNEIFMCFPLNVLGNVRIDMNYLTDTGNVFTETPAPSAEFAKTLQLNVVPRLLAGMSRAIEFLVLVAFTVPKLDLHTAEYQS